MAEKLLTLIQDTTGDEIYPNIKEDNIPPSVKNKLLEIDSKQDKLTDTQMYAVNSGITQYKVGVYDGYNATITKLNTDLTDAINEINNKQDKIFTSTANPFVLTEDGTGIDLHKLQFTTNGILKIGDVVTQIPSDTYIQGELDKKQDTLVSGTNIKTLNGQSILGSGDLAIGGGGESVSPTLNLIDFQNMKIRETITEQEKINLENGIYNQALYTNRFDFVGQYALYTPSKLFSFNGGISLAYIDDIVIIGNDAGFSKISLFRIELGEKNASSEYPITITKFSTLQLGDYKSINLFGNHSILVPNASTDTAINLYNHFINITGTDGDKKIVIRFTIQSSKDTAINTIDNLSTLLGNEFELGCSGIYSTYNITGLKKNADISLSIIYNNNGAESLLSSTGLTLTISDTVKTI